MQLEVGIRKLALGALAAGIIFAAGSAIAHGQAATGKKPNVIVIFGDDVGWGDLGAYGGCISRGGAHS